jgi:hypothetical protein
MFEDQFLKIVNQFFELFLKTGYIRKLAYKNYVTIYVIIDDRF